MRGTSGRADFAMIGHNVRERRFLIRGVKDGLPAEKTFHPTGIALERCKRSRIVNSDTRR